MSCRTIPRAAVTAVAATMLLLTGCSDDGSAKPTPPTAPVVSATPSTTAAGSASTTPPSSVPSGTTDADLAEVSVRLTPVATVDSPTAMAVRSGTDDLYVAERAGRVRRLRPDGAAFDVADDPVVDLSGDVSDSSGERGLLGLAFSPDGSQLFVSYTDGDDDGASVIAGYRMDGQVAEVASRREILRQPQPFPNHNGGNIVFGPDGYLWIGFGDGGSQGDPNGNGQDLGVLLAKLLRIDVLGSGDAPYAVPADNPFVDRAGARNEVWASGLRNPWRFSFDRATGDLWIGDVGGAEWEEIDHLPVADGGPGKGANLGWSLREGAHDTDKGGSRTGLIDPVFEYSHDEGSSITGGYVYRGARIPALRGAYLFSDFSAAKLRALTLSPDGSLDQQAVIATTGATPAQVASFGEDATGELYLLDLTGEILRLDPAA